MPNVNCCIPYCCADSKRHRGIRFYTLPKDRERRQAWILLIRNINLRTTSRYTSVCSLHFPGGSKTYDTKDPSIFPWSPQWPAVVNEYNNRQKMYENDPDSSSPYYKKSRPMTLRIPPMCPWASQFNEFISSKSVHDFYSPKTLQVDMELQDVTSNSATSDFLKSIEAECQKIKSEPLEPVIYPTDENKYDPSMGDKMSIPSPTNNKNLNLSEFCTASPLSSELLLQSPINNNDLHSTLFSSSTLDNQITEELVQVETEIRRRTLLMNDHYNRKLRQEFHKDSSYASNKVSQMNVQQTPPTEDLAQTVQIQSKKNLPTGWNYWPDLEYNLSSY